VSGSRGSRSADREEPNRVLGFPLSGGSRARHDVESNRDREAEACAPGEKEHRAVHDTEQQRVLGFPVSWFGSTGQHRGLSLVRPLQAFRRRLRRPASSEQRPPR
jgi:hypothetical protein